jgi:hypothetical protein
VITRQIFEDMLSREKKLQENLKTSLEEIQDLKDYVEILLEALDDFEAAEAEHIWEKAKRGKPLQQPPSSTSRASDQTDTRLTLVHDAECTTRKVYE